MMMRSGFKKNITGGHQRTPNSRRQASPFVDVGSAQQMGRHGDTMLAHINEDEARLLKQRGGSGTRNPFTGLPEFFGETEAGTGNTSQGFGGNDRDRGFGGGMDVGMPGTSSFGRASTADRQSTTASRGRGGGVGDRMGMTVGGFQTVPQGGLPTGNPYDDLGAGSRFGVRAFNVLGTPLGLSAQPETNPLTGTTVTARMSPAGLAGSFMGGPVLAALGRKANPGIEVGSGFEPGSPEPGSPDTTGAPAGPPQPPPSSPAPDRSELAQQLLDSVLQGPQQPGTPRPFQGDYTRYGQPGGATQHRFFG